MNQIRVLLIEDNPGDARLIQDMLADVGTTEFVMDWKQTLAGGLKSLAETRFDAVLLDLGLPDSPQRAVSFTRTQTAAPTVPIIILTGHDDDAFAATTVRRGAQDYLVKGKIDSTTLVRTIRYAIARKLGGERLFTVGELAQYDGKEGRAAYIAFKGRVYDVSNSRLWKDGKHGKMHSAGADLTEAIVNAPHGEETIARLPILGELARKQTLQQQLFRRVDSLHPHTTFVHLSVTCALVAPFTFGARIFGGREVFDEITFYFIVLGLVTVPLSFLTGLVSWTVSYESKATTAFNFKIALGILLFIIMLSTFIWRLTGHEVILSRPGSFLYLASLVIQFGLVLVLDYYGKKTVYS